MLNSGSISLSFWRPQRLAIPGVETGDFLDIGRLHYGVIPFVVGIGGTKIGCKGFYSNPSSTLAQSTSADSKSAAQTPYVDTASDAAPDADRKLSFTLDVAGCLSAQNIDPAGKTVMLALRATGEARPGGVDSAGQNLVVRMPV